MFHVGLIYKTNDGRLVGITRIIHKGSNYECVKGNDGIWRYSSRDYGRVTGTNHDGSCPLNIMLP